MRNFHTTVNGRCAHDFAGPVVLLAAVFLTLIVGPSFSAAQNVVTLPQLVLEPNHTEYVYTQNPNTPNIVDVKSTNPSVAKAAAYRTDRVQIVAVGLGKTDVEFFDTTQRVLYRVSVWVEKSNATGGGGAGYDPRKTQLNQVVMLVKHVQNVTVPGGGSHQLSSVVSSNPSVATARTNTNNMIQIYAVALGDTFIDFTDNATGTTYQVHVWVRETLAGPDATGAGSAAAQGSNAKPNPVSGPRPGSMDKCLVGRWVSESVHFSRGTSGGAGAIVVVKADGSLTADYDGMSQIVFNEGSSYRWTGTAAGHISAEKGLLAADRLDKSTFNFDILDKNGQSMIKQGWWRNTLGAIFPPSRAEQSISYTCSDASLTIVQTFKESKTTINLKRRKQ
jgi:hypothetical protein